MIGARLLRETPRLAWISTIAPTGGTLATTLQASTFTRLLLPYLVHSWDVELFVDDVQLDWLSWHKDDSPEEQRFIELIQQRVFHYHRIEQRQRLKPFSFFVQQIEDNTAANFCRLTAASYPGVVCFHDLRLNNLYRGLFSHTTAPTELNELAKAHFGPQGPPIGDYHIRHWSAEVFDRRFFFGKNELEAAALGLCFNDQAVSEARNLLGQGTFEKLQFPVAPINTDTIEHDTCDIDSDTAEWQGRRSEGRSKLAINGEAFVVACFAERYLFDQVVPSFAGLNDFVRHNPKPVEVLWCCSSAQVREELQRRLGRHRQLIHDEHSRERFIVCPPQELQDIIPLLDVALSLRSDPLLSLPTAIEQCVACGVPVIVAQTGAAAELPKELAFKIPLERGTSEYIFRSLQAVFQLVSQTPQFFRKQSKSPDVIQWHRAKSPQAVAEEFRRIIAEQTLKVREKCDNSQQRIYARQQHLQLAERRCWELTHE